MRITLLLAVAFLLVACSQPPPPTPTPDLEATIQAAVEKAIPMATNTPEHDLQATVHAGIVGTLAVMASTPSPTPIPSPTATPTTVPTDTPTPTKVPTYTPVPVPTDTPTPLPTDTPTPVSVDTPAPAPTSTPVPTSPIPTATSQPDNTQALADVVEQARATVVRIEGTTSTGSGFVVDPDGYILTNEHVINGQSHLTVVFDNGTRLTARVIASDAARDIALLKVSAYSELTVLPFANQIREGDEVVAFGYPLDFHGGMTVTKGIVSAFRTFAGVSHIQTDAALNPGNSGGPLLNTSGEIVGMNTSVEREISGEDYSAQGIGFAIKSDVLNSRLEVMKSDQPSDPMPIPTVASTQTPNFVFGPEKGSIKHDTRDSFIDTYQADISVADAVIEARFFNPYSTQDGNWSSGFIFRKAGRNTFHIVAMSSDGTWYHYLRTGDVDTEQDLAEEFSNHIDTAQNGDNLVRIITRGAEGWLFINSHFISTLDLSSWTVSGSVSAVGAYFTNDGIDGESTRFEDFTIRSLQNVYGPKDGSIQHDREGDFINEHKTRLSLTDGIIEAHFSNPYDSSQGDWSSGFLFRNSRNGGFHVIVIQEDGRWHHDLRVGDDDSTQDLAEQYAYEISTTASDSNHIRVITLGIGGWLFINGVYVDKLDLSGLTAAGRVSAITNYFTRDGLAGYSTSFQDFTIWSAD